MRSGRSKEKGFTLVELLASMAISGMVMGAGASLIFQQIRGDATIKTTVAASHEIGNAVRSISEDGMMAEASDLIDGAAPVDQLTLTWVEWYQVAATSHQSTYWLSGTDLKRGYDGVVATVAQDITSIAFSQDGRVITVVVRCTPPWTPSRPEQQTFRVWLRPRPK